MENELTKGKNVGLIRGLKTKIIVLVVGVIVIVGVVYACRLFLRNKNGRVSTISESSLEKIIEINELSTVDYTYNAVATKYAKDNTEEMYHVAYEGTVTAGIDFQKIKIAVNEDEKKVTITLPEAEIHATKVTVDTMDYIFVKDKYETETISGEAYKLCKSDLKNRIKKEKLLLQTAKENAVFSVEALFKPWIETVDKDYKVEIR